MADPLASMGKIVKVAFMIKQAVETVRHNKEECIKIDKSVSRITALLSRLQDTNMMEDPSMRDALEDLDETLCHAHTLVTACQERNIMCLFCRAGHLSKQLRQVQDDILQKVMLGVFATSVQVTIILSNIQHPRPPEDAGVVISSGVDSTVLYRRTTSSWSGDGGKRPTRVSSITLPSSLDSRRPEVNSKVDHAEQLRRQELSAWRHEADSLDTSVIPMAASSPVPAISEAALPLSTMTKVKFAMRFVMEPSQEDDEDEYHDQEDFAVSNSGLRYCRVLEEDRVEENVPAVSEAPLSSGFTEFSFSELEAATNNFSEEFILGQGGFATVYKGVLRDGLVVAIKKFHNSSLKLSDKQLVREVRRLFSMPEHKNIVRVLGYCRESSETSALHQNGSVLAEERFTLLVKEYAPNGTLEKIIKGSELDWSSRFRIIQGIAEGVHYLHSAAKPIFHLDLKPENILLDSDMNPKIDDFGIARLLASEGTKTQDFVGTVGYMPPEYIMHGRISAKNDVYSFGIILLETISGMSKSQPASHHASIAWAWAARKARRMNELFDPSLCDESQLKGVKRCMEIGLLCTQENRKDRPTMAKVVEMLNGEKKLPTPKQPGYTKQGRAQRVVHISPGLPTPPDAHPPIRLRESAGSLRQSASARLPPPPLSASVPPPPPPPRCLRLRLRLGASASASTRIIIF